MLNVYSFYLIISRPPISTLFPYTTLFRSLGLECRGLAQHPVDRPRPGDLPEQRGDERGQRRLHDHVPERSEEHTSELQSLRHLVCRLLLEKKKHKNN